MNCEVQARYKSKYVVLVLVQSGAKKGPIIKKIGAE